MSRPVIINSKDFRKELEKKNLEQIYLFLGEEDGEKEKFIQLILGIIYPDGWKNNSPGRFYAENGEFSQAVDFALSRSIFSEKRLCVIFNIDALQKTDSNKSLLSELIDTLPDLSVLIMTSNENKIPGIISADIIKKIKAVQFWRYFQNELYRYISDSLKKLNIRPEEGAIELLLDLTGRDIRKIDAALLTISNSMESGTVTREALGLLIHDEKEVTAFDFIDCFFLRKKSSFLLLKKILEDSGKMRSQELLLLSMITRRAEMIESYHYMTASGVPAQEILKTLGVFPNKRESFMESVSKNPRDRIETIFPMIYRADYRIKSINYSNNIIANPIFDLAAEYLAG